MYYVCSACYHGNCRCSHHMMVILHYVYFLVYLLLSCIAAKCFEYVQQVKINFYIKSKYYLFRLLPNYAHDIIL